MGRTITAASLAAVQAQGAEIQHLLSLDFSAGTVRFTSGPHDVTWNGVNWSAAGSAMSFEAVTETPDPSGQRLQITLDGVSLGAISALLAQNYIGRTGVLRRAYMNSAGAIIVDPIVLFTGYMNTPWEVTENWDKENPYCKVTTELVSPLAVFNQLRGITADKTSHQRYFAGDTFFAHIVDKPSGDFGWGVATFQGGRRF